ncbi:hypothetical protein K7X08_027269 [Anisodus acutangulus]|uniref:AP2/ERF domain-containing protein n=1 Tax=Anisodus acutangulus TaxID=402998 RepID=A0A9Q1MJX4_9SOLA|nr:hypothetical protein K7X08_027269 [Anisodus acutangulus]
MAASKHSSKSKKPMEEEMHWQIDKDKNFQRQQLWPVSQETSMSGRSFKMIKNPESQHYSFQSSVSSSHNALFPSPVSYGTPAYSGFSSFPSPSSSPTLSTVIFPLALDGSHQSTESLHQLRSHEKPLFRPTLHQNQQQMISFSAQYPQKNAGQLGAFQNPLHHWNETSNLSPSGSMTMMVNKSGQDYRDAALFRPLLHPYSTTKLYRGVRQRHWAMAYDREAYKLRGDNAKLNFPELFLSKNKENTPELQLPHHPQPEGENFEEDSGIGSSEGIASDGVQGNVENSDKSSQLLLSDFEAWFNAIPEGSVWDDLDIHFGSVHYNSDQPENAAPSSSSSFLPFI